ncbi:cytochrome P450 71D8-like [Prosopis cineraria]|uniref:cytochrome P450 71D8-like n=1 Tax=Prosopis cineraria TaxID=364024 RepID=UPI002410916B|nr:cytochrome P450 71D8-like [Prosopis cineraria]
MDLLSSIFIIIFFLCLFLLLARKNSKQNIKDHKNLVGTKLPPGPRKLPLIGNLHQLAMAGSLPHHILRDLSHKYGPLMHLQLGEISAVIVSSPEMAKEIMKTHDLTFAQRGEILGAKIIAYDSTDIAFAPYGEYWRQMRKICTIELLSAKRVQSFTFVREDEVAKLVESIRMSSGTAINLTTKIFSLVSTVVCRTAFGKKTKDEDEFLKLMKQVVELTGGFDLADLFPSVKLVHIITRMEAKLMSMHKKLDKIIGKIVKDHQVKKMQKEVEGKGESSGVEDLVDVLLRVQQNGDLEIPITDNNVKAVIWDIFAAGTDTTATTLDWAMAELMRNPRVREKAQAEIRGAFGGKKNIQEKDLVELSYLKLVVKETLRLHPPGPLLLPRECGKPCDVGGYKIPTGTKVIVNAWAIGRDPEYWRDAERFLPERFQGTSIDYKGSNFEYIPFGAGRRMCPGSSFALPSIELTLACLLYHFNWELPDGMKPEDLDMSEVFGVTVAKKNNIYLIPTPHSP